jgi:hypothetical protein
MRIAVPVVSATQSILIFLILSVPSGSRAETGEPVFIKASCQGMISSAALSELHTQISGSHKYRVAERVEDEGRMDVVQVIYMDCTEHNDIVAIATVYGKAKCLGVNNCHLSLDGASIRSDVCDSKATAECGRTLFKAFADYVKKPIKPQLVF